MSSRILIAAACLGLIAACAPAAAGDTGVEAAFSAREAEIIRAWYASDDGYHGGARVRHKGRKSLPPGIAKNLVRGKPLPPGIAKQTLPAGLIELLPPAPRGFERIEVAGRVLLVEVATQVVHDVLEDLILR